MAGGGAPPSVARLVFLLAAGCWCCCFLLPHPADAARQLASPPPEADALLKFKTGVKDDAGALKSWAPGTSPCNGDTPNWAGVMCSKDGVYGLQLESMGLAGPLDLRPLKPMAGLRTLSVMSNQFSGPMPEVKELSGLRAIFLSDNKFSGEIPADAFAGMGSLKKIHLSNNNFTGPIPASLADVPKLLELNLNGNKFQGKIPDFPQKELQNVNLSDNELEGEIPASLKSVGPEMFAGNKKLCGGPLDAKCEAAAASPAPSMPAPSTPAADKPVAQPSPAAADTAMSTGPADDAVQNGAKPTESSTSYGVLAAFLGMLAFLGIAFVAMQRRREYSDTNFGPAASGKPAAPKIEPHPPAKDPRPAHAAPGGAGDGDSTNRGGAGAAAAGGTVRKGVEQGRLTYVRDDRGRFFELQDLLKATAEVLGTANLGVCYRATLMSGHSVVVKRFKEMNRVGREDFEEHMRRLGRLTHPNLLPLVAYYYRKEEKLLIHDYVPNRSLANLLHGDGRGVKRTSVHWTTRLKVVKGVARALSYLYDELCMLTVPHGHLKASNILLGDEFQPLLTDYALVPVMNQSHAAQLMVAFKCPERKQFGRSSKKSDVWCLGLLILEVVTGRPASYEPPPKAAPPTGDQPAAPAPAGNDLVGTVASTPEGEWLTTVVDADLRDEDDENKEEVVKLLRIGMACCESNVDNRWELKTAVDGIEELKGKERASEDCSFYSSVNDEDFSNVAI
ncbi:hypothetical protein ACP70R_017776 [Stipagrostis hirtigluma subsp. patula]